MNIKRSFALVVLLLFAAPLAATTLGPSVTLVPTQEQKSFEHSWGFVANDGSFIEAKMLSRGEHNGAFAGIVSVGGDRWLVKQFSDGRQTAEWQDPSTELGCAIHDNGQTPQSVTLDEKAESVVELSAPVGNVVQDVLVLTTPATITLAGGQDMFDAELGIAKQMDRDILVNSNAPWLSRRFVGGPDIEILPYDVDTTTWWPGDDSYVRSLREQYKADIVMVILPDFTHQGISVGGYASIFTGTREQAYGVVIFTSLSWGTLSHEMGHVNGLLHNIENDPNDYGLPHYAHSMSVCFGMDNPNNAAGIMSATPGDGCGSASRVEKISGDGVYVNGAQFWNNDYSRQVQVLEQTAATVAGFANAPAPCVPGNGVVCIDSSPGSGDKRFAVHLSYNSIARGIGGVAGTSWTSPIGVLFWFFSPDNPEVLAKILNGCDVNNHFWLYLTAGTDLSYAFVIIDSVTGQNYIWGNPDGVPAEPVQDVNAIPCN